ncbi:hypothetical protein CKO25_19795 [Thiocapsa imhoffii]|uniref:Uncharacterized protein n=1 Tax=Thiocapsa imhoffii TaxID=382777 RepID=A0A9X1BBP5_9GAMM|nr:hypothetical protein [Thiocapsa imhoffii]MBK1646835.1 hypothetical protein [Thiocapsa imhoffii]
MHFDNTIDDALSTTDLFAQIEAADPQANVITIICDNARYDRNSGFFGYTNYMSFWRENYL